MECIFSMTSIEDPILFECAMVNQRVFVGEFLFAIFDKLQQSNVKGFKVT